MGVPIFTAAVNCGGNIIDCLPFCFLIAVYVVSAWRVVDNTPSAESDKQSDCTAQAQVQGIKRTAK